MVELSSASGENDCHSWLPSRGVPHDGQDLLPAHRHCHIHTHPVRDTHTSSYTHLHTCSYLPSVLRDARRVHTHNKARISTIKLSAGREAVSNHTLLSPIGPCLLIIKNKKDYVHSIGHQTQPFGCNFCISDTLHSLHQNSVSPSRAVLTSISGASLMQLRISQCYPTLQKEVALSQSVSCRVSHTSHCCLCAFSLITSLLHSVSLCGKHEELFAFSCFTLTIDHFGESCNTDSNTYCISAGLQCCFTGCIYAC